jgi:hypothetical protein
MKTITSILSITLAATTLWAAKQPGISGDYLEVRSCDVYTGPCVANAEMGVSGKEGMLVWSVRQGAWQGTALDGLSVIAVVQAEDTLGDLSYQTRHGKAVLLVDDRATSAQREALVDFARTMACRLIKEVVAVKAAPIDVTMRQCDSGSCATVKAGRVLEISTRCLAGKDHLCGNEENYYPPLTEVKDAFSAYTELAAFRGADLNSTWQLSGKRSAYLAAFVR